MSNQIRLIHPIYLDVPMLVSFAAAVEGGSDLRTVHELLGHRDVNTTMICAHVLNRGGLGVNNLADRL